MIKNKEYFLEEWRERLGNDNLFDGTQIEC